LRERGEYIKRESFAGETPFYPLLLPPSEAGEAAAFFFIILLKKKFIFIHTNPSTTSDKEKGEWEGVGLRIGKKIYIFFSSATRGLFHIYINIYQYIIYIWKAKKNIYIFFKRNARAFPHIY